MSPDSGQNAQTGQDAQTRQARQDAQTRQIGRAGRTRPARRTRPGGRTGRTGGFWSPPNMLSLSRIAAVPFIYWGFARDAQLGLYALIGWAFLTDAADGYLARRFRWESKWGLVLDPLADKILVGSLAVFLVLFRDFPLWAAALVIARDLAILGAGAYLYLRPGNLVLPADRIGKLTTLVMGGALFLYAADLQPYGAWALWAALCCVVGSGIHYVLGFARLVRIRSGSPETAGVPGASGTMDRRETRRETTPT